MKTVFMYAGQGSQCVGMGQDLSQEFATYKEIMDSFDTYDEIKNYMQNGPMEELTRTDRTQPALSMFSCGVTDILKENGIKPDAALGLSLGEFGAFYAANVYDKKTFLDIVAFRGQVMQKAAEGKSCAMSAVLGLEASLVEEGCKNAQSVGFVKLVNYNCPGQYVICGDKEAVAAAEEEMKKLGAKRCVQLNVGGPFHTHYMSEAGSELSKKVSRLQLNQPSIPVVMNITGDYYDGATALNEIMEKQIQNSVRFEDSVRKLIDDGFDTFIEIGPKSTLASFVKKVMKDMGKEVKIYQADTAEHVKELIETYKEKN